MSFFPEGFDPRDQVVGLLTLIEIDTPDGPARFMPGTDGTFCDVAGNSWVGSQLLAAGDLEWSRDGQAPEGQLVLSYFQDPKAPDLIHQLRELGADYVLGREVRYLLQPIGSYAELSAPVHSPIRIATRIAGPVTFTFDGAVSRQITLAVEGPMAGRRGARGWFYTTEDHERLTGAPNPSLEFMPQDSRADEQLFG